MYPNSCFSVFFWYGMSSWHHPSTLPLIVHLPTFWLPEHTLACPCSLKTNSLSLFFSSRAGSFIALLLSTPCQKVSWCEIGLLCLRRLVYFWFPFQWHPKWKFVVFRESFLDTWSFMGFSVEMSAPVLSSHLLVTYILGSIFLVVFQQELNMKQVTSQIAESQKIFLLGS